MKTKSRFSNETLAAIRKAMVVGVRAGTQPHRFIAVWVVVAENRVFARSWSLTPKGWYQTFCEEPSGTLQVAGQEIAIRAIRTRSERLKDAVNRAYHEKYKTPGSAKYVRDLCRPKSRATTIEFVRS